MNERHLRHKLPRDFKTVLDLVDLLCDGNHFEFSFRTDGSSLVAKETFIKVGGSKLTLDKFSVDRANIGDFCVMDVMCETDKCTNLQCADSNGKLQNDSLCTNKSHCNSDRCVIGLCKDKVCVIVSIFLCCNMNDKCVSTINLDDYALTMCYYNKL